MKPKIRSIFHWAVIIFVSAAVIGGIVMIGTPSSQRMLRLDTQRIRNLKNIRSAIDTYWTRHQSLPINLDSLSQEPDIFIEILDPETKITYEYRIIKAYEYELCASFSIPYNPIQKKTIELFWAHEVGEKCYLISVDTTTTRVLLGSMKK